MKHIAALFVLCLLLTGCASSRFRLQSLQAVCGTNYEHTVYMPALFDPQTGKTWILRWDADHYWWQPVGQTNAPAVTK